MRFFAQGLIGIAPLLSGSVAVTWVGQSLTFCLMGESQGSLGSGKFCLETGTEIGLCTSSSHIVKRGGTKWAIVCQGWFS